MVAGDALDLAQLAPTKPMIFGHTHIWIKPEFDAEVATVHMHMPRFATVIRIEVKAIGSNAKSGWHSARSCRVDRSMTTHTGSIPRSTTCIYRLCRIRRAMFRFQHAAPWLGGWVSMRCRHHAMSARTPK